MMKGMSKNAIYLDYASTAPVDKDVVKVITNLNKKIFANPSAVYKAGLEAGAKLKEGREKIAGLLNAHADEIIFTGSGTESNALAIIGLVKNYRLENDEKIPHIISTNIEHSSVLENLKSLERDKFAEVTYVPVDANGLVSAKDIHEVIRENTILVSVMYANNEIGTIEPIQEIAKSIRHSKKERQSKYPFFHTDACQAMNYLFMDNMEKLGVDMLTFNGSKIYGPKGVGVLYKKRNVTLSPIYAGGGQEFGLRSGTENMPLVVGIALALEKVCKIKEKESARLKQIRDYGIEKLLSLSNDFGYDIVLNGGKDNRLPNNINLSIKGLSSELVVIELDALGIMVSEKSACGANADEQSHVVKALHEAEGNTDLDTGSVRITLGQGTKKNDMDTLANALKKILTKYKQWKAL